MSSLEDIAKPGLIAIVIVIIVIIVIVVIGMMGMISMIGMIVVIYIWSRLWTRKTTKPICQFSLLKS